MQKQCLTVNSMFAMDGAADVVLHCHGQAWNVHGAIISARSSIFQDEIIRQQAQDVLFAWFTRPRSAPRAVHVQYKGDPVLVGKMLD